MIPNAYLSVSKTVLIVLLSLIASVAIAQRKPKPKLPGSEYQKWLKTQWWLGLKAGTNFTQPNPGDRYSSIDPINYDAELLEKTYNNFDQPGLFIGLDLTYYNKGFMIALTPGFKRIGYSYNSSLEWTGDTEPETFQSEFNVTQNVSFIELPIGLRYELLHSGKLRPYLVVGMQYSFVIGANKKADITYTDFISGTAQPYDGGTVNLDVKDEFQNYFGAFGGLGFGWDVGNIRTVLEVSYSYGLSSITDTDQRYSENDLATLGDINDQINVNGINATMSVIFPLRYIDNTFSSR
ncbi:MAG: PorT family protein [Reichenbachiella sp.]